MRGRARVWAHLQSFIFPLALSVSSWSVFTMLYLLRRSSRKHKDRSLEEEEGKKKVAPWVSWRWLTLSGNRCSEKFLLKTDQLFTKSWKKCPALRSDIEKILASGFSLLFLIPALTSASLQQRQLGFEITTRLTNIEIESLRIFSPSLCNFLRWKRKMLKLW
jgi:hypothetical protein